MIKRNLVEMGSLSHLFFSPRLEGTVYRVRAHSTVFLLAPPHNDITSAHLGVCALLHYGGTNLATPGLAQAVVGKGKSVLQGASYPEVKGRKWGWTGFPQGWGSRGPGGVGEIKKPGHPGRYSESCTGSLRSQRRRKREGCLIPLPSF